MHDGIEVGGVEAAGNGEAEEGGDIRHAAAEGGGILLVGFHIGGIAERVGDGFDFVEPGGGVIGFIVDGAEGVDGGAHIGGVGAVRERVPDGEQAVVEEIQVGFDVCEGGEVLAGLLAAAGLLCAAIDLTVSLYTGRSPVLYWSLFVLAPCLILALVSLVLNKRVQFKEEMRRRFFI